MSHQRPIEPPEGPLPTGPTPDYPPDPEVAPRHLRWFWSDGWHLGRVRVRHRDGTVTLATPWWRPDGDGHVHTLTRVPVSQLHSTWPPGPSPE